MGSGPELDLFVQQQGLWRLPKDYQAILNPPAPKANVDMLAKYDAVNPPALKRLIGSGVKLLPFSNEIMAACYKATKETYDEIATKNDKFKKIYEPWQKFRTEQVEWFAVAENRFDNFMIAAERMSQKKTRSWAIGPQALARREIAARFFFLAAGAATPSVARPTLLPAPAPGAFPPEPPGFLYAPPPIFLLQRLGRLILLDAAAAGRRGSAWTRRRGLGPDIWMSAFLRARPRRCRKDDQADHTI